MIFYEPGTHKQHGFKHDPFKAFVTPRPIGWIGSIDADGRTNLAPYSFFNAMASNPPQVVFGSGSHADGSKKDSQRNVEDMGEFTVNIVAHALREQMNETSAALPHGDSEFDAAGIEGAPSKLIKPLRVAAAPVAFECVYLRTIELEHWSPPHRNFMVLGKVIGIHVSEDVVVDGLADVTKWSPVSRLGYFDYSTVDNVFEMFRPSSAPGPV
ncbi:MAG: flavin reductase family protein [Alphaproteobacteria bacterium]|nr:flavin reductase family protein [Alphaproteobacteria bacterium]